MAEITVMRTPAETGLAQQFEAAKAALPGDAGPTRAGVPALRRARPAAPPGRGVQIHRPARPDARSGSARAEAVRGEAAAALARRRPSRASKPCGSRSSTAMCRARTRDLDRLPAGVEIVPLAEALAPATRCSPRSSPVAAARDNSVYQLNAAFMADGAVIRVAAGRAVETPVHLRFVNAGAAPFATATRVLVVVEEGASRHAAGERTRARTASPTSRTMSSRSWSATTRPSATSASTPRATGRARAVDACGAARRAVVVRHAQRRRRARRCRAIRSIVAMRASTATARVNGAAMLNGRQHADTTLLVDHAVPHCESAASCSRRSSTARRPASSRARSSSRRMRRRPTAA